MCASRYIKIYTKSDTCASEYRFFNISDGTCGHRRDQARAHTRVVAALGPTEQIQRCVTVVDARRGAVELWKCVNVIDVLHGNVKCESVLRSLSFAMSLRSYLEEAFAGVRWQAPWDKNACKHLQMYQLYICVSRTHATSVARARTGGA